MPPGKPRHAQPCLEPGNHLHVVVKSCHVPQARVSHGHMHPRPWPIVADQLHCCAGPSLQDGTRMYLRLCKTGLCHIWSSVCTFLQLLPASLLPPLQDWLLTLVPHLVHAASNVLADVTATGCHPRDLLPSMLAGQCGGCSAAAVFRWGYDKVAVT